MAKQGIPTIVTTKTDDIEALFAPNIEVLAIDIESRHSSRESAYRAVYGLVKTAIDCGIACIYKKTDSSLRGNIGAELQAVLDASDANKLNFIPAFPKNNRVTVGGHHYVNGVEVGKLVFGRDPFEPVRHSYIPDIIHEQSSVNVLLSTSDIPINERTILIHDASDEEDLERIAQTIKQENVQVLAGCAGFAEYLPQLIHFKKTGRHVQITGKAVLVISGSLNDIALRQINHARFHGYPVTTLSPEQKVRPDYWKHGENEEFLDRIRHNIEHSGIAIIESVSKKEDLIKTNELAKQCGLNKNEMRIRALENIAAMVSTILSGIRIDTLVVFGGDTLIGITEKMGMSGIIPIAEIAPGVVLSEPVNYQGIRIVSKSGGFGDEDIIEKIIGRIAAPPVGEGTDNGGQALI